MNGFVKSFIVCQCSYTQCHFTKIRPFYYYIYTEVNEVVF